MSSDRETLQKIIDLFQDEERFTRTFLARDKNGTPVEPEDPKAYCFCVVGALRHFKTSDALYRKINNASVEAGGLMTLTALNDYGGRIVVLKLLNQIMETLCSS